MKKLILILLCLMFISTACNSRRISDQQLVICTPKVELYNTDVFDTCIEELKLIEGFASIPYFDVTRYTIGYGHQLQAGEVINNITKDAAEILLIKDFKQRVKYVHNKYGYTGNKLLALARFTYNLGRGRTKTLLSKPEVERRWLLYCNVKHKGRYKRSSHLYNCRKRELELWFS